MSSNISDEIDSRSASGITSARLSSNDSTLISTITLPSSTTGNSYSTASYSVESSPTGRLYNDLLIAMIYLPIF